MEISTPNIVNTFWTDIFILLLVLTNFRLVSTSRLAALVDTMIFQALILSAIPLTLAESPLHLSLILLIALTLVVKAVVLPALLRRAMRSTDARRDVEPFVGYSVSVVIGIILLGLSFVIMQPLASQASPNAATLLPGALFTMLTGLFIIISRRKALTQVVGYLAMENGIYAFGAALAVEQPLLVEMGVLLDVFVAVFVMGITIYQISREFDHIDTDRLSELHD